MIPSTHLHFYTAKRLDIHRQSWRRNRVVLAIVVVVVAVKVVTVPIAVYAVHDDHPLLRDPFPRTQRSDPPRRNGRSRPVMRMVRDVVAGETGRGRMVAWLRTGMFVPCCGRPIDMTGRSDMLRRGWLGRRPRGLMGPRLLGRSCLVPGAAAWTAFRSNERRCAECRAGDSNDSSEKKWQSSRRIVNVAAVRSDSIVGRDSPASTILRHMRSMPLPFVSASFVSWQTRAIVSLRVTLPFMPSISSGLSEQPELQISMRLL